MKIRSLLPVFLAVSALGFAPVLAQQNLPVPALPAPLPAYRMSYPELWSKAPASALGVGLAFVLPVPEGDLFEENLNLVIRTIRLGTSLEEYSIQALADIRSQIADVRIVESSPTVLGDREAFRAVFTGRMGSSDMKWLQVWALRDGRVYVFTFSAEEIHYDRDLAAVERAIGSFEFQ